jgi:hypothetical protein
MTSRNGRARVVSFTLVLATLVVFQLSDWPFPITRGRLAAKVDLEFGRHEVLGYRLPGRFRVEYARLLRDRYGIHFRTIALCIVSQSQIDYADSYNALSMDFANRKFRHDVFKECYEEARLKFIQGQTPAP